MRSRFNLFPLVLLAGCATSSLNYTPPHENKIKNQIASDRSFDQVWDQLVRNLSSDFFVINNIDKNSRLINVSFSSKKPTDFVDCGDTVRTFKNLQGEQGYSYKTADSSVFTITDKQGVAYNMSRETSVSGRINIYVAPEMAGAVVSVNTKYVLSIATRATRFAGGAPANFEQITVDFSTKEKGTGGGVTCSALGTLENRILAFVRE